MKHGIYTIKNLVTDQLYIGSAVNLTKRLYTHKNDLQRGQHRNKILQRSKNPLYGKTPSEETLLKRSVSLKRRWAIRKGLLAEIP